VQKHTILVFANLKPGQVNYKILPLSRSEHVEKIIILRKEFMEINQDKVLCLSLPGIMKVRPFYWFVVAFYGIWLIKRYNVSLILNYNIFPHGFNAWFASLFTKRPVIFAEINEDTIKYHRKILLKPVINTILSNASYITVPGSVTEDYWKRNGFSKIFKLHSTIDTDLFLPDHRAGKRYDFIFIGEFDSNKRPDLILDAFIEIRGMGIDVSMCFIGFGKLKKSLEDSIFKNGINNYVSIVETNNVLEHLHGSRVLVMASLSEGLPCAMLEAMSCELIVLVPPVGNISDVVKNGVNGFLHDNTQKDIVKYMIETHNSFNSLDNLKRKARETIIEEHSFPTAVKKWDELLAEI
jgi:glycosyltransferase involved in cell wall biosynthesis